MSDARIKGIDVSSYQGTIDWGKAAADGVQFAILKVIRKDLNPDKQFEANWAGATEAGVPIQGVYNYTYATTVDKAKSDAEKVIEILNGRKPMVWLDVEDSTLATLGEALIDVINAYGRVVTGAGLDFGVYSNLSFYGSYVKPYAGQTADAPYWVARYPSSAEKTLADSPADDKRPTVADGHELYGWQWSSTGRVDGISGNVDLDELYVAVATVNVVESAAEESVSAAVQALAHYVGEEITVSSYYASSTDDISKAVIRDNSGTITRVKAGANNPYCFGKNGVAIGWCNDGDIRSSSADGAAGAGGTSASTATYYTVKSGDTLSKIAKECGTTVDAIMQLNADKIKDKDKIYVGWVIRVK